MSWELWTDTEPPATFASFGAAIAVVESRWPGCEAILRRHGLAIFPDGDDWWQPVAFVQRSANLSVDQDTDHLAAESSSTSKPTSAAADNTRQQHGERTMGFKDTVRGAANAVRQYINPRQPEIDSERVALRAVLLDKSARLARLKELHAEIEAIKKRVDVGELSVGAIHVAQHKIDCQNERVAECERARTRLIDTAPEEMLREFREFTKGKARFGERLPTIERYLKDDLFRKIRACASDLRLVRENVASYRPDPTDFVGKQTFERLKVDLDRLERRSRELDREKVDLEAERDAIVAERDGYHAELERRRQALVDA
jgi:predicted  nucleic acid-binding Zn-ribbon protein